MKLRTRRRRLGLSQLDVARQMGRTQAFVSMLEAGQVQQVSYDDVLAMAKALNYSPDTVARALREAQL